MILSQPAEAQVTSPRGRPQLNAARTTFVADNGQRLRGPYTSTEWTSAAPADQIANMRNLGFNAVHLYAEVFSPNWPTSGNAPGYNVAEVDKIVQRTRDAGLYLIMTIGNGANNGNHNIQWATNFWNFYGARYANETHVIYEIHNEPMAWGPSYLTGTTPAGTMNMEIAAYRAIRANAPNTPVLLFSYAVLSGSGGANAALTDIQAFNQAIFGVQNAVWTNEAVAFHGYGGWEGTATAVNNLINAGYPCFMTEFGWPRWGRNRGVALELELTTDLERLGVSWLTFQYIPPSGVSDPVTVPELYKDLVDKSGLGWTPDFGTWPALRGVYGNNNQPRSTVANWVNNFLTGTLRIQAEDFDWGGEGVSYHDTTATNTIGLYRAAEAVDLAACNDTGGGFKVSEIQDGEWLEYSILVRQPGYYNLALRYATPNSGGTVEAYSAIAGVTARRTLTPTGSHTTWATATVPVYLSYGRQLLRLQIPTGGFDLNWIELTPVTTGLLANGTYKFLNAATALAMEGVTGTNRVVVTNDSGATVQRWNVQHVGGGQYRVVSMANNYSWNDSSDVLALVSSWNTSKERCYLILPESGGFHRLLPVSSGLSLHGPSTNGVIVQQQEQAASASQLWAILPPATPAFPIGLSATAPSATTVSLTWITVPGATSYSVKRSASSGGPYATLASGVTATNYTDTVPAGMKYYYVVSAFAGAAESPNSLEISVNPPYPWASQDIGSVGVAGGVSFSNGVFTVSGSGGDIWGTADAFRFVYLPVTGNGTITARVLGVQNTDVWAKAGVMIRANLASNVPNAFIAVTPGNGVTWQTRAGTNANSGNSAVGGLSAPYWVRLVRSGNTFTGYRSTDGVNWTQQGTATFTMSATAYVGLAVTAHNNSSLCIATFDNVTMPGWSNWTLPAAPAALAANAQGAQVVLSWPSSSTATSYNLKRATTAGGPYTILTNLVTTNYTDAAVTNGTTYYYVVSALNPAGEGANSVQATVTPQFFPPTGVAAVTISASQIDLTWNAVSDAISYNVKRSLVNGGPYATVATGLTTTNHQDGGLAGGTIYYYVVSAVGSGGETPNSAPVTATTQSPTVGSLVHRYSFSESGGATIADVVGGPIWNGTLPSGGVLAGGTLSLASSLHQYGTLPAGIVSSLSNITVMAWLNLASLSDWSRIFEFGSGFTTNMYLTARSGLTGNLQFGITTNGSGAEMQIGSGASLTAGAGHQVAVTLAAGRGVLYLDGVAVGTNANLTLTPASLGMTGVNYLGKSQYSVPSLNGALDEFRIYQAALSAAEIAATAALGPDQQLSTNSPALSLTLTGTNLTLAWPLANAGYTVQSRTNLTTGDWMNSTSPAPQISGNQWQVTLPATANPPSTFYRLAK